MKPLTLAKTRLGAHLDQAQRAELSLAMLSWVLGVLRRSSVSRTVVVGGDYRVRSAALAASADWDHDPYLDLNVVLTHAFETVWRGGQSAAYVPADLPLLTAREVDDALRTSSGDDSITICPAHDGGTNGLIVPASAGFGPRLGPDSFARHTLRARELGLQLREFRSPGFERDVDTIVDLRMCIDQKARCLEGLIATSPGPVE